MFQFRVKNVLAENNDTNTSIEFLNKLKVLVSEMEEKLIKNPDLNTDPKETLINSLNRTELIFNKKTEIRCLHWQIRESEFKDKVERIKSPNGINLHIAYSSLFPNPHIKHLKFKIMQLYCDISRLHD